MSGKPLFPALVAATLFSRDAKRSAHVRVVDARVS